MADYADIQSTYDNSLFHVACHDVLRIVSILSLDSTDVTKVSNRTVLLNAYEKAVFFLRFLYMVFVKGFTPTIFDVLPYFIWKNLSIAIYIYRLLVVPIWLRVIGYGKYVDWSNIGSKQPSKDALESKPLKLVPLTKESNLSNVDFGEEKYEEFITTLYRFTTHLSPHSHSPLNPFVHNEFPGNFFDHLTGVYKILLAWRQPQYVVRAGLFHSVYGTFDYRYSLYDLREGRSALRSLIGDAAEEISFAICTSDRIGLIRDLVSKMYGSNAKLALDGSKVTLLNTDGAASSKSDSVVDGNPYPPLVGRLEAVGFSVRNHITQQVHILSPDLFAQFSIVMVADFMEQGVVALGAADNDICMFRFMRYRFWSDFILYLGDYLREKPAVWAKYLGKSAFIEPTREEVIRMKGLWFELMDTFKAQRKQVIHRMAEFHYSGATAEDKLFVASFIHKYPYIAEPFIFLGATMTITETIQSHSRKSLADEGLLRLEEWGMLTIKSGAHGMKEVLGLVSVLQA